MPSGLDMAKSNASEERAGIVLTTTAEDASLTSGDGGGSVEEDGRGGVTHTWLVRDKGDAV